MTGAFYPATRTHHAYSMAIDFGMKFKKRDGFWTPNGILTLTGARDYKLAVADESMSMLVPRAGDVVRFGDAGGHAEPYLVVDADFTGDEFDDNVAMLESFDPSWWNWNILVNRSIIQRNGVAFQWP